MRIKYQFRHILIFIYLCIFVSYNIYENSNDLFIYLFFASALCTLNTAALDYTN